MRRPSLRRGAGLAAALALGAGVLLAAGCGDDTADADLAAGKQTFSNVCASCHTLADSGAPPSRVGPSLDDSFRAARQAGMDEEQFAGVVSRWIEIAQPPMPRDLVTGQDKVNVAAYIASVAGTQPESEVFAAQPEPPEAPDPPRQEQHPAR